MSYSFEEFAPQGWQCPVCKRIYSPTTPMCWYCGGAEARTYTTTNATIKTSATEIAGLWCDDITFCQEECERIDCPRNQHNIRDKSIPHSFSVEIPKDCPKVVEAKK